MNKITKEEIGYELHSLCNTRCSSKDVIAELKNKYSKLASIDSWHELIINYKRTRTNLEDVASNLENLVNEIIKVKFNRITESEYFSNLRTYSCLSASLFPNNIWVPPIYKYPVDESLDSTIQFAFDQFTVDKSHTYCLDRDVNVYIESGFLNGTEYVISIGFCQVLGF